MGFWKRLFRRRKNRMGYKPDPVSYKDWDFAQMKLGRGPDDTQDGVSFEHLVEIQNQLNTNSCVANAWELALMVESRLKELPPPHCVMGSRLFGYYNSRAGHNSQRRDKGTHLRTYADGLRRSGRCAEEHWPFNTKKVNRRPSVRAYQQAHAFRGLKSHYRIRAQNNRRCNQIAKALRNGHCVVFGMQVNKAFLNNEGPKILNSTHLEGGKFVGGHAMCVVGYRLNSETGEMTFRVANSWGTNWRDDGFVWFSEDLMKWSGITDVWVGSL